jgi:glycosyltransferase involved in cell wall biosynthesis
MQPPTVLFISHLASRTGAPLVLLQFLSWLRTHAGWRWEVLLREGGELEPSFKELAPCSVYAKPLSGRQGLAGRALAHLGLRLGLNRLRLLLTRGSWREKNIRLVYSNTVVNGDLLEALSFLKCPVITHVHELERTIHYYGRACFQKVQQCSTHYIAASRSVRENLIRAHKIPGDKIDVVPSFIRAGMADTQCAATIRREVRQRLGVAEDALLICACGGLTWLKGADLFFSLARAVRKRLPERRTCFLWIGAHPDGALYRRLAREASAWGNGALQFTGPVADPTEYFTASDLFALVSREESLSLVMLEAASVGKPIVCFSGAGGAPEFVSDDCGFVVSYQDTDAMADAVVFLARDDSLRERLGRTAMRKVRECHEVGVAAPRLSSVIERFLPH